MANLVYSFSVRNSANAGAPVTGLTPTFSLFKALANNANVSNPTISEIGLGLYKFSYDFVVNGEAIWQVDAGNTLTSSSDRYIDGKSIFSSTIQPTDITSISANSASLILSVPANKLVTDATGRIQVQNGAANGQLLITGGAVTVNNSLDKTGYSLTQVFPTNFANLVIDTTGKTLTQWGIANGQINLVGGNLANGVPSVTANVTVAGYQTGQDPATLILVTPANKLVTDATGRIQVQNGAANGQLLITGGNVSISGIQTFTHTGNIVGSVTGSVNSVVSPVTVVTSTFPTNFANLVIDTTGKTLTQWGITNGQINLIGGNLANGVPSVTANVTVGAYQTGQDPATLVLSTPANKLVTDATGRIQVQNGAANGQILITAGGITVNNSLDKTGYSLTQVFPSNFANLTVAASGGITVNTNLDKTSYVLSNNQTFTHTGNIVGSVTGSVNSVVSSVNVGSISSNTLPTNFANLLIDSTGYVSPTAASANALINAILNTAMPESYANNGANATLIQALYMILSVIMNVDQSGTVLTARKLDGTTQAEVFTLDNAVNPTSRKRIV